MTTSINISRYVDVTSVVGGASAVPVRNLGGLIVTNNPLVPTGQLISFTSAANVGTYFGTASEEYTRAVFYFGWISKNGRQANLLSFWFWNNDTATASLIFGAPPIDTLAQFNAITAGEINLTLGGVTHTVTCGSMAAAGSLAAVATIVTTAINAYSAGGTPWTGAVCSYNSTTGAFNLVSGDTAVDTIGISAAVSSDLAGPLGWLNPGTVISNGTAAQLLPANLNQLYETNNNFGSLCLCTTYSTLANVSATATWNYSLTPNVQFIFSWAVSVANASAWQAALATTGGQSGTLISPQSGSYSEMEPMMIFAATDYTARNAVQNYEFQVFNDTPTVTTDAAKTTYDTLKINYYGQTQNAGVLLQFYQQGVMSGGLITDPADQNTYANEIWLKANITAGFMNLLLAMPEVPVSNIGLVMAQNTIQASIQQALFNGTISVGKPLDSTQKLYITNATGDPNAWQQVQNAGYWVGVGFQSYVDNGVTKWKIVYTLIYSKSDAVRFVQGTDILI